MQHANLGSCFFSLEKMTGGRGEEGTAKKEKKRQKKEEKRMPQLASIRPPQKSDVDAAPSNTKVKIHEIETAIQATSTPSPKESTN